MRKVSINLTADTSFSPWISTFGKYSLAADFLILSSRTWSTAVIGMEWSIFNDEYANPITFSPTVVFNSTTKARVNINIASKPWVRFRVTTAEALNDPVAQILYMAE